LTAKAHELEHRVHNILSRIRMVVERSTNEGISLQEFREALCRHAREANLKGRPPR
jgi:hypothetical protein